MTDRIEVERAVLRPTKLFVSYNTAHRSFYVLAQDQHAAINVAWSACHIRHTDNGLTGDDRRIHECASIEYEFRNQNWPALVEAAQEGRQGTVVTEGTEIYLGSEKLK